MSTYTQIIYQIVFSTKYREPVLIKKDREKLFKFIWGIIKNKNCHLYRINGVEDHIHIVTNLHPSVSLSSFVRTIKVSSSLFIKEQKLFKGFKSWQGGYGAFTYSIKEKERLINYVKNQESHHNKKSYKDEFVEILKEHDLEFQEEYFL